MIERLKKWFGKRSVLPMMEKKLETPVKKEGNVTKSTLLDDLETGVGNETGCRTPYIRCTLRAKELCAGGGSVGYFRIF